MADKSTGITFITEHNPPTRAYIRSKLIFAHSLYNYEIADPFTNYQLNIKFCSQEVKPIVSIVPWWLAAV